MISKEFNKGIFLTSLGSFWWGFFGVIYFKYISFVGHFEVLVHRCIWTTFMLTLTTIFLSKIKRLKKLFLDKKTLLFLLISSLLIFINWGVWIYAVGNEQIIDASFGYFIMPILSVFFGNIFFKEKISSKGIVSLIIVMVSILF